MLLCHLRMIGSFLNRGSRPRSVELDGRHPSSNVDLCIGRLSFQRLSRYLHIPRLYELVVQHIHVQPYYTVLRCISSYLLVFLAVQSRACGVVFQLQLYVRHQVDAEVVAELFEGL